MDSKSRILVWSFVAVFLAVGIWKYDTLIVKRNYLLEAHISCDPSKFDCFKAACDSSSGEDCTNQTYAKIEKYASNASVCDKFHEKGCPELSCAIGEAGCKVTYCSSDALGDGESCVGPDVATSTSADASTTSDSQ